MHWHNNKITLSRKDLLPNQQPDSVYNFNINQAAINEAEEIVFIDEDGSIKWFKSTITLTEENHFTHPKRTIRLNKDNFWEVIEKEFPRGMEKFGLWIDEYKNQVGWGKLFKANENTMQLHSSTYKFHEIPFEMQVGVIAKFLEEGCGFEQPLVFSNTIGSIVYLFDAID